MISENRLSGHTTKNLTHLALVDIVTGMTSRAGAVVEALQIAVENKNATVYSLVIFNALESVGLEIADIQEVTRQFHLSQKSDQ